MLDIIKNFEFDIRAEFKDFKGEVHKGEIAEQGADYCVFKAYSDEGEEKIRAEVKIIKNDETASIYVDTLMAEGASYDIRKTFFHFDSIKLFITPKKEADCTMGSHYIVPEKSDCWTHEFFCKKISDAPKRCASVMWKSEDEYFHMLPLCDSDFKSEIHGNGKELEITVAPYTGGYRRISAHTVVLAWDKDPYKLMGKTVEAGFSYLGLARSMRKDKKLPEVFDYLGWCSWDSCSFDVTADKILKKAEEFHENDVPVKWMLVDDGWYVEKDGRKLWDFYADKEKFPQGIKPFTTKLKKDYGMKWVGFWQCFSGGWRGINPNGPLAKDNPTLVTALNSGEVFPNITKGGSFEFWDKWNRYLKSEGTDFVKVDVQTNVEACTYNNIAVGKAAESAYYGFDAATAMYYNGAVINCTGMAHECLWNRPLGILNRNSEDFLFTDVKTMRNFSMNNVYNSMYHSEFCYGDWDMMQTMGATAKINTVLHAVSGAPVYFSDPLGQTDKKTVMAFADSKGKLYKCDDFALPTPDRLFKDAKNEEILLKFFNKSKGAGYLGVINVNSKEIPITDTVSPSDVYGLEGDEFILRSYFSKNLAKVSYNDRENIVLEADDAEIYEFTPIKDGFAFIGNIEKYISAACVTEMKKFENRILITLREGGKFAYYCNKNHELYADNKKITPEENGVGYEFCVKSDKEVTVEIVIK